MHTRPFADQACLTSYQACFDYANRRSGNGDGLSEIELGAGVALGAGLDADDGLAALAQFLGNVEVSARAAKKRFEMLKFRFKFPRARTFELYRARSRLYRSQILQVNTQKFGEVR